MAQSNLIAGFQRLVGRRPDSAHGVEAPGAGRKTSASGPPVLLLAAVIGQRMGTTLRGLESLNTLFLQNPKAGCSTVAHRLWKEASGEDLPKGKIHDMSVAKFDTYMPDLAWGENAVALAFVRHPLTRLVSAFHDKILNRRAMIRRVFCERYGLDFDDDISIQQFITLIHEDPRPNTLDPHWRPQYLNIRFPFIVPNYLGRVESLNDDLARFLSLQLGHAAPVVEAKNVRSADRSEEFAAMFAGKAGLFERVLDLYANDFKYFGYPTELADLRPEAYSAALHDHGHPRLAELHSLCRLAVNSGLSAMDPRCDDFYLGLFDNVAGADELAALYAERAPGTPLDVIAEIHRQGEILTRPAKMDLRATAELKPGSAAAPVM